MVATLEYGASSLFYATLFFIKLPQLSVVRRRWNISCQQPTNSRALRATAHGEFWETSFSAPSAVVKVTKKSVVRNPYPSLSSNRFFVLAVPNQ